MKKTKTIKDSKKKTLSDAKVLVSWLYNRSEDGIQTVDSLEKSFMEELKLMGGDCIGTVEIIAEYADGSKSSERLLLRDVVKNGLDLPADVANFYIDLKVVRGDKFEQNTTQARHQQIFKSDMFFIKENNKTELDESDGIIIEDMEVFSDMSGGNIRFKNLEDVVEI